MAEGPFCGKQTHHPCIVGCRRPPAHGGKCRCEHDQPATKKPKPKKGPKK